jgi:predicted nucleic acid-binding protein
VASHWAFWDSSALVPLFVEEASSGVVNSRLKNFRPVVWWGTFVEIHGAMRRIHRAGGITEETVKAGTARLAFLRESWNEIQPTEEIRELAVELLNEYSLRAADSLQLAASLSWCNRQPFQKPFLCGDKKLCHAASSVGFTLIEVRTPSF